MYRYTTPTIPCSLQDVAFEQVELVRIAISGKNSLTDIRYQYAIDVYRAPLGNLNVDGWEQDQMLQHMIDCINSDGHNLT